MLEICFFGIVDGDTHCISDIGIILKNLSQITGDSLQTFRFAVNGGDNKPANSPVQPRYKKLPEKMVYRSLNSINANSALNQRKPKPQSRSALAFLLTVVQSTKLFMVSFAQVITHTR